MKPPECAVCGERFEPSAGELVSFQPDDLSRAFRQRQQNTPGFVGHPPNEGWFCSEHLGAARDAAASLTLPELLNRLREQSGVIREGQRASSGPSPEMNAATRVSPQVDATPHPAHSEPPGPGRRHCGLCGNAFDERTGALVAFARTAAGTAWHARMIRGEADGVSPDRLWTCNRHACPALRVSHLERGDALGQLMSQGAAPLEYDAVPIGARPDRDESSPPLRGPFLPVSDDELDGVHAEEFEFPGRSVDTAVRTLRNHRAEVEAALGVGSFRHGGSISAPSVDANDRLWAPDGTVTSSTVQSFQRGEFAAFLIDVRHRAGDRRGPTVAAHCRLLVQCRELSILDVTLLPAASPNTAQDGVVLLERAVVRRGGSVDVGRLLRLLRSDLGSNPFNPLDPAPELVDVDLGSGEIQRGYDDSSSVVWTLEPRPIADVSRQFSTMLPTVLAALGLPVDVGLDLGLDLGLAATTKRTWNPMDGSRPPNCPFTDTTRSTGQATVPGGADHPERQVLVETYEDVTHWSDVKVSNSYTSLSIVVDSEIVMFVSAASRSDGSDATVRLSLARPASALAVGVVRQHFDHIPSES